jgi:RimJ/RimL family protein N-acetyltransferase
MNATQAVAERVEICATRLSDLPSLVIDCLNPVFLERKYLAITEAIPVGEAIGYHATNIAAGHPHYVVVAGDRVVGICDVVPSASPRISSQTHNARLGMLLSADYRGHGLGEKLLCAALTTCGERWERIELSVYSHNERAHKLYMRCGFLEEGRRVGAWKLDGAPPTSSIWCSAHRRRGNDKPLRCERGGMRI